MVGKQKITGPAFFIGKEGDGLISFGSGQPDLPPPKEIFKGLENPRLFKYGLIQGDKKLREALAGEYPKAKAGNFVITNGASEALDLAMRVLAKMPGQNKILLCRPYYYSYPPIVEFAGLQPIYTQLKNGLIDLDDFKKKIKKVKAVLINSPSNPTGRVETMETLKAIERITKKLGVWVISDEVYKDLIYGRENYLIKGRHVITINSFSKTYAMCGLRVGYLYSPDREFVQKITDMKVHTSMNTNSMGQAMALSAMRAPRSYVKNQVAIWEKRRDLIYGGLIKLGFDLWKPEGAFYVLPKIKNTESALGELYYKYKVIVYNGAWFGAPGRIRLSYALDEKKIEEGLRRIKKFLKGKESWLK
ncbi:MAG: aminotransferase class I/II-fold pyridoxal phosphate-dependent enzyme [Candidatus Giovannonibacteria bacterium]|nr:aminotransferase class I/II-fold pyridoxal phosphate-dependent enzyme [Candidatus Giovannonibacteria bacterium]